MSLGIFMKGLNTIYFGKMIDFWFEFLPQIILLLALFGWMDLLIIFKWVRTANIQEFTADMNNTVHNSSSIITTMINMFLSAGSNPDYPGQLLAGEGQATI